MITPGLRSTLLAITAFTQTASEGTSLKHCQVGSQSKPNTSLLETIQLLSSFSAFDLIVPIIDNCDFLSSLRLDFGSDGCGFESEASSAKQAARRWRLDVGDTTRLTPIYSH